MASMNETIRCALWRLGTRAPRVCLAAAFSLVVLACGADPEERDRPAAGDGINVLLITIDTLRADALGAYDTSRRNSPNIDRMASEGVLFEQAVASAPSTIPSHSTIMTGKQPYAHGVRSNNGYVLAKENVTLAERLRDAGYATAAEIAAPVLNRRTQLDQGFDRYTDSGSFEARLKRVSIDRGGHWESRELEERDGSDITRRAIEFLGGHKDERFFLWLHYFDPHVPYAPPPSFTSRFPDSSYHAEVAYSDHQVGRVLEELERLGIAERTLVVLTSDHGEGLGDHNEETHAYLVYNTTTLAPLILWGPPELPRGLRIDTMVRSVDIAPTVLDWLGLPQLEHTQGRSLRPLILNEFWEGELTGYGESIEGFATFGASPLRYIRVGRWKYIHKVEPELYDVLSDPGEMRNLVSAEPETMERLRNRLRELLMEAQAVRGAEVTVDPDVLAQLGALGYVGSSSPTRIDDELATLELSGVDASTVLADITRYATAWGAFSKARNYPKAEEILVELRARYPESVPILKVLAQTLMALERPDEGLVLLQKAVELAPKDLAVRLTLATAAQEAGALDEAEEALRVATDMDPCGEKPRIKLANLLVDRDRYAEQVAVLAEGVERCPDEQSFHNDYAYARATSPDPSVRDGFEALRIASEITRGPGASNPAFLDTLATAYAENGDFGRAAETSRRALELLTTREVSEEALELFRSHLASFAAGQPVREP
jgi:arylsulfatase A-like enzyme/Flp pilus assembly protein TadD